LSRNHYLNQRRRKSCYHLQGIVIAGNILHFGTLRTCMASFLSVLLLVSFLLVSLVYAVVEASPLPCASLSADQVLVEAIPSSTCLRGIVPGITLYNRSVTGVSLDDAVIDILLPFPFRWFDVLYNGSVSVGSNSYVTFGGSSVVFSDFSAFNPPFPSLLIGSKDLSLQLLRAGRIPQGWLVRFEGALLSSDFSDDVDPVSGAFVSSSSVVWELLFADTGGLQLCVGKIDQDALTTSGVSNQKSSSFAHSFALRPNFLYRFDTTCAQVDRASLSAPIAAVSGARLSIALFVSVVNASYISSWTITLRGAGLSCPSNASVALTSSPPQISAFGRATISANISSSPVLTITGIVGAIKGSVMLSFTISNVSAPHQPQDAISNLGFAGHDCSGRRLAGGDSMQMDAVLPPITLHQTPLLELSPPVIQQTQTRLRITLSLTRPNIIFRQYEPAALVITVTGTGWQIDAASVVFEASLHWNPVSAGVESVDGKLSRIRINFDTSLSGVLSFLENPSLTIFPITSPRLIQSSFSSIAFAILNTRHSVLASGTSGVLGAIQSSTMGLLSPSISLSSPLASQRGSVLDIALAPTFWTGFRRVPHLILPAFMPALVITLTGRGIACPDNAPVTFLLPFGASGVASIDSSDQHSPVLRVTISSGFFQSGSPIWFQVTGVSTPLSAQPFVDNITSVMYGDDGSGSGIDVIVSASVSGTMGGIVGGMGASQPFIQHVTIGSMGQLTVSFTTSAFTPANSKTTVTLAGLGMSCADSSAAVFASPPMRAFGTATFVNEPLASVLSVTIPDAIPPNTNVSFSLSPIYASFASRVSLSNVHASLVDNKGQVLAASASGVFVASTTSGALVKDHIADAADGIIILPAAVFAGSANCNNVINETMPPRKSGVTVVLKSSGSGAVVDCSGTTMRCLVVYRSSISITNVRFKGGSSPRYVLSSTIAAIKTLHTAMDAANLQAGFQTPFQGPSSSSFGSRGPLNASISGFGAGVQPHPATDFPGSARYSRLLLSSASMFDPNKEGCGGCIMMDAANHSALLLGVSLLGCSALYGGGGFFNVSVFRADDGSVSYNAAQQGGGLFVLSAAGSSIKSVLFFNNTVATMSLSKYEISSALPHGFFSQFPDPFAAAGGAAWFQLLHSAEHCTFTDNTAIAAGTSDAGWYGRSMLGVHALGSALFVLETRHLQTTPASRPASLSDLVFVRSRQLCAGWCVSAGALFVGAAGGGIAMARFVFKHIVSSAVTSEWVAAGCRASDACIGPSISLAACVVIVDMSAPATSTLQDTTAEFISILAVGSIYGGLISVMKQMSNAAVSNVSFSDAKLTALASTQNGIFGLFAAHSAVNSSITLISTRNVVITCIGRIDGGALYSRGIFGGVMYSKSAAHVHISEITTENIALRSSSRIYGGVLFLESALNVVVKGTVTANVILTVSNPALVAECFGGVMHFSQSINTHVLMSTTRSLQMHCSTGKSSSALCECRVKGGVLFTRLDVDGGVLSNFSAHSVALSCEGPNCFTAGGLLNMNYLANTSMSALSSFNCSVICAGASCKARGVLISIDGQMKRSAVSEAISSNSVASCDGVGCYCLGGELSVASVSASSDMCSDGGSSFSSIESSAAYAACRGDNCFVLGGIAYFEKVFCLVIYNVTVHNSQLSSNGTNSKAAGGVIGVGASNRSDFRDIRSLQSSVLSRGNSSQALAGALSILSGNVSIRDCFFSQSTVRCIGHECAAAGGFISVISTLEYNSDFNTRIDVFSSLFSSGRVTCTGFGCFAYGGAIATGTSYRASVWIDRSTPALSDRTPPQVFAAIRCCSFTNNSAATQSHIASAGGGALSIRSSAAALFNCSFAGNFISTSKFVAFAGGGALHMLNPSCRVTAEASSFVGNDASSLGQGGAVLAAVGATFNGSNLAIDGNRAGKGGGILIDASEAHISDSVIRRNVAATSGGGLFCSSNQAAGFYAAKGLDVSGISTITLKNTSVRSNSITEPLALGVGSDLFVIGSVFFAADSLSDVSMSGYSDRDIMSTVVTVLTNSPHIAMRLSCMNGTMLRIAPTSLSNTLSMSVPPSNASLFNSKCFPACLELPVYETYVAASGVLASCTPCPRGTYNLGSSRTASDTVQIFCRSCPFGANCYGGDKIVALESHWGWQVSESLLPTEFLLLPEGYGCSDKECTNINSCGANHNSVLCGGCVTGYSAAFFTTECVADAECSSWKLGILVVLALVYSLFYSIYFRYDAIKVRSPDSSKPTAAKKVSSALKQEPRTSVFHVLMWYYQLVGLLLSMPSPLKFLDGNAIIMNIIGLVFGTVPVSQVFSLPSLVFCTAAGSAPADILLANVAFYALWAVVMIVLTFPRVWLPIFRVCHTVLNVAPEYYDHYELACEAMAVWGTVGKFLALFLALKWSIDGLTWITFKGGFQRLVLRTKSVFVRFFLSIKRAAKCSRRSPTEPPSNPDHASAPPLAHPNEVRGRAWLDFGVTAYSAFMTLMIQFTTCVTVQGLRADDGSALAELRWFYDGRIACFSDSGERAGQWQIAALVAVVALTIMPVCLAMYMQRAVSKPEASRNIFDVSALPSYFEQYNDANRHWFTVM
jgi:hypothetical protein